MTDAASPRVQQNRDAETSAAPQRWLLLGGLLALTATLALWVRFGEGVYAQAIMNAVLACF
jgi:hypothetical protein